MFSLRILRSISRKPLLLKFRGLGEDLVNCPAAAPGALHEFSRATFDLGTAAKVATDGRMVGFGASAGRVHGPEG